MGGLNSTRTGRTPLRSSYALRSAWTAATSRSTTRPEPTISTETRRITPRLPTRIPPTLLGRIGETAVEVLLSLRENLAERRTDVDPVVIKPADEVIRQVGSFWVASDLDA